MGRLANLAFIALMVPVASTSHSQTTETRTENVLTFLSHRSGCNQIYAAEADGSNLRAIYGGPITDIPAFSDSYIMFREPHWTRQSPNGQFFASWVYESGKPYSEYQGAARPVLCVGDIAGTWTRIANPDCQEEFAWSPDSKQLAFSILSTDHYRGRLQNRTIATEICISGIDGSGLECVLECKGKWFVLDWSPDGKRLLIARRETGRRLEDAKSELFSFRLADAINTRNQMKYDPEWNVLRAPEFLEPIAIDLAGKQYSGARYSPTRNEIAIEAYDPKKMYAPNLVGDDEVERMQMMRLLARIYVVNFDADITRLVADYDDGIRGPICWTPDGNEIYFSRYLAKADNREKLAESKEHGLSIWAIGRDGENPRFVTTGWSPDFPRIVTGNGK